MKLIKILVSAIIVYGVLEYYRKHTEANEAVE